MFDFCSMRRKREIELFEGFELVSVLEGEHGELFLCYWMDLALPAWKTISDYKELSDTQFYSQCSTGIDVHLYVPLTQEVYEAMESGEVDIRTGMLSYNGGEGFYQIGDGEIVAAKILEKTPSSVPDSGVFLKN